MSYQSPYIASEVISGSADVPPAEPFLLPLCLTYEQYEMLLAALFFSRGLYSDEADLAHLEQMIAVFQAMQYINNPQDAPCFPDCGCEFCATIQEILDTAPAGIEAFVAEIVNKLIECCVGVPIEIPPSLQQCPEPPTLCDQLTAQLGAATDIPTLIALAQGCGIEVDMDFEAQANTLPAGSPATAEYDAETNTFVFGIPQGAQGEQGEQGLVGERGEQGADGECLDCEEGFAPDERAEMTEANACASATAVAGFFQQSMLDVLNQIEVATSWAEFVVLVTEGAALSWIPIIGDLADSAVEAAFSFVAAITQTVQAQLTTQTQQDLQCALYCLMLESLAANNGERINWSNARETLATLTGDVYPSGAAELAQITLALMSQDTLARQLFANSFDESAACASLCECAGTTWCYEFDMLVTDGGWVDSPIGVGTCVWAMGLGWKDALNFSGRSRLVAIERSFSPATQITGVTITGNKSGGSSNVALAHSARLYSGSTQVAIQTVNGASGGTFGFSFAGVAADRVAVTFSINDQSGTNGDPGGSGYITKVILRGTGVNPFGASNCT